MRGSLGRLIGLASLAVATLAAAAAAAQPLRPEQALSAADGLSGLFVEAVAVDATGFLWVGTQNGLDRYDGVRLLPFEPPGGVRALAPDAAGNVWAAGAEGTWVYETATGRLRRVRGTAGGPLGAGVRALAADRRGVWIGTVDQGLVRVVPGRGRYRRFGRAAGLPSDSVKALLLPRGAPGEVWVGTPAGVSRLVEATGHVAATLRIGAVAACAETSEAGAPPTVWCATRDGALHALDPATGRTQRTVRTGAVISALVASRSRPGVVWIGTRGRGLLALDTRTGAVEPALSLDAAMPGALDRGDVIGLAEDAGGLVWLGTADGLFRADTRPPPFAPGAALAIPTVLALHEAPSEPGVLWIGTRRGGLVRLDRATGATRTWFDAPGDPLSVILAVHEDRRRRLWLGSTEGALIEFDRATGQTRRVALDARPGVVVITIGGDRARPDVLWVGTQQAGLLEVDVAAGRVLRQWAPGGAGRFRLDASAVRTSVEMPSAPGVRWIATDGAGLMRLDVRTGRIAPAPVADGCAIGDEVFSVAVGNAAAGDGGALWVGRARDGLVRYDVATGRCRTFPPDDGRRTNAAAVVPDARGRVWMSTSAGGIVLVDPRRGTQTRFTTEDGLPSDVYFMPASGRTAAGEILFGGPSGFVAFRPETIQTGEAAPRVVVTGRRVDGRTAPGVPTSALTLSHDRNDVAFEFAALDLRRPAANRYRVRLDADGEPGAWVPLGSRADIRFPYLAPGRYTLRVAGAGPGGVWADAPPVALTVRPPLWRRGYVWVLVGLLAVALVAGAYQLRIREILRTEATRRRIADDLHDDIGSKVSTVALRLDLAGRSASLSFEDRRQLASLAGTARGVVTDLRDAVWFVDAGHDSLAALVDRIELATGQMCAERSYTVDRPATLPDVSLSMERRRHLFLWVREALHNTCKHGVGHVRVSIAVEGGRLTVAVADDGPGFDPATGHAGRGLTTLAGRAEALGGACVVESAPGRGTVARVSLPLRG